MARKPKTTPVADDELEELDDADVEAEVEPDDEVDDSEVEGLTAKALAKLLGTDGRTVRKFLRSKKGKVGQGQRWNIDPDEVDDLRAEFAAWGKKTRGEGKKKTKTTDAPVDEVEELDEENDLEDLSDLEELDDLELDDEVD